MKKTIISFFTVFVLVFSLVGCIAKDNKSLSALAFTPTQNYRQGSEFSLDTKIYFKNTTDIVATYTTSIGSIADGILTYTCVEVGDIAVTITATAGKYSAELKFCLNVIENDEDKIDAKKLAAINKSRALELAKTIKSLYWNSETESSKTVPNGSNYPYLWPYTEQVAMVNAVLPLLDKNTEQDEYNAMKKYLEETLQGLRYYRVKKETGYTNTDFGVLSSASDSWAIYNSGRTNTKDNAGTGKDGIYFDDNIWVAKEFYNAYKLLGDKKYLNESINIVNWIIDEGYETAIDPIKNIPMNGIYWNWGAKSKHPGVTNDSLNASLNACSTAPTAMVLVKLYKELDVNSQGALRDKYLKIAKALFSFSSNVLKNEENLYQDKVFIFKNESNQLYLALVDKQILPYNTGCMLTAGAELYENMNNSTIMKERNKATAISADNFFANPLVVEGQYAYNPNSWFTSFLLEGFIDIYSSIPQSGEYIAHMESALEYAWKNFKADDGLVSPSWVVGWEDGTYKNQTGDNEANPRQILLQAANAHCYAMLSNFYANVYKN